MDAVRFYLRRESPSILLRSRIVYAEIALDSSSGENPRAVGRTPKPAGISDKSVIPSREAIASAARVRRSLHGAAEPGRTSAASPPGRIPAPVGHAGAIRHWRALAAAAHVHRRSAAE